MSGFRWFYLVSSGSRWFQVQDGVWFQVVPRLSKYESFFHDERYFNYNLNKLFFLQKQFYRNMSISNL